MKDPSIIDLPAPAEPQKIAILGAGMAGLATAEILLEAGHEVVVFEAQMRAGGRVYTSRQDFAEGLHIEFGASRFPDCHELTLAYCRRLGLKLVDFMAEDLSPLLYLDARRFRDQGPLPEKLGLPPGEQGLTAGQLEQRYLQPWLERMGDPRDDAWPREDLLDLDDMSYAEALRRQGASPKAIRLLSTGFNVGEGLEGASALWLLRSHALDAARQHLYKLADGNDRLPQALALQLSAHIRYGFQVLGLKQDRSGVELDIRRTAQGRQQERFDRVICALPFPLLAELDIHPLLSWEKRRAIRELPQASMLKVLLQTRRPFWEDLGLSGFATVDLPMTEIWNVSLGEAAARGVLLAYLGGTQARQIAHLDETDRLAVIVRKLSRVFPELPDYFEGGRTWSWDAAPWARGAGAWFAVGQIRSLYPHIANPEGRIHFAGDHTSPWPGWVQGALHSAQRVAREVNSLGP